MLDFGPVAGLQCGRGNRPGDGSLDLRPSPVIPPALVPTPARRRRCVAPRDRRPVPLRVQLIDHLSQLDRLPPRAVAPCRRASRSPPIAHHAAARTARQAGRGCCSSLDDAAGGVLECLAEHGVGEVGVALPGCGLAAAEHLPDDRQGTPPMSASLADECRRSCRRTSGMPMAVRMVLQVRFRPVSLRPLRVWTTRPCLRLPVSSWLRYPEQWACSADCFAAV